MYTSAEDANYFVFHPPSFIRNNGRTDNIAPVDMDRGNNNEDDDNKTKQKLPSQRDPGYLFWLFRFLETEDSPLDLIGDSCYKFILINVRQDIVLEMWNHRDNNITYDEDFDKQHGRQSSFRWKRTTQRFVAWTHQGGCCRIGLGRLLHWIIGLMVPAIQGWLLYLVYLNMQKGNINLDETGLNTTEQIGIGIFMALELAPHVAQGFGLFLLPFYRRKWNNSNNNASMDMSVGLEEKKHFIRNEWVETKLSTMSWWDCSTIMFVGIIQLGITGAACWLGLMAAFQQDTFVVAILRVTVALFVERLDEKVHRAWKLFATPWAYHMAQQAISEFGVSAQEKEE